MEDGSLADWRNINTASFPYTETIMTGTKLGPFILLEKIGEGGMGVVYKAKDTRLERVVAIKLLPESLAADPGRRARFVQEARAASALNHPNIVTIHEIAEHEGHHYIVMEYLEGRPLSEAIPAQGMRLTDALRAAVQIADALSAAHAAGLVHRDLKPGNIMIDGQGRAKVLDFGLAKLTTPAGPEDATRTLALGAQTEAGTIMGSVPYMSPEQAEGRPVDARSDIFSFGAVLYEMVTGKRAFQGESRIQTLAAVVRDDPTPASQIASSVPSELERLISRCLRKDVAKRSQSMPDVKLALEELRDDSESGRTTQTTTALPAKGPRWLWPAVAGAFALAAAGALGWNALRRAPAAATMAQLTRVTPDDGYNYGSPTLSPDGKFIASISDRSGTRQVWLHQVGGNEAIQVTRVPAGVQGVDFFPDGRRLLVTTLLDSDMKSSIEEIPMLGGNSRVLVQSDVRLPARLSPDGKLVAYFAGDGNRNDFHFRLMLVPVEGGAPRELEKWRLTQSPIHELWHCRWSPNGHHLLVLGALRRDSRSMDDYELHSLPVDGSDPIATGAVPAVRAAGLAGRDFVPLADRLLFAGAKDGRYNVWQIRFDPETRKVVGAPSQLTNGTEMEAPIDAKAGQVVIGSAKLRRDLYLLPTDPVTGQVSGPARRLTQDGRLKEAWSPGGDPGSVYYRAFAPGAKTSSPGFAIELASGQQRQLSDVDPSTIPNIAFDGRQVAYSRADGGTYSISIGEVGAAPSAARPLCERCGRGMGFSRDGKYILVNRGEPTKPRGDYRGAVVLLEVATGKLIPWLEDEQESVTNGGVFGGNWIRVFTTRPGDPKSGRRYLLPWRTTPVPRAEWAEIKLPGTSQINRALPFAYLQDGDRFTGMRFDGRRFGEPFPLRFAPGSVTIGKDDHWWVRGPGIAFVHVEAQRSVWLMKAPE